MSLHFLNNPKLVTGYILTISFFMSLIAGLITGDYRAMQYVSPGWIIYLGFLFGDTVVFNRKGNNGNGT